MSSGEFAPNIGALLSEQEADELNFTSSADDAGESGGVPDDMIELEVLAVGTASADNMDDSV